MKKTTIFVFATILSFALFAQKNYDLANFNSISHNTSADVTLSIGSSQSVSAEGSAEALANLVLEVKNNSLEIKRNKNSKSKDEGKVKLRIVMTDLKAIASNGSGDFSLEGDFSLSTFAIAINGSSDIVCNGNLKTEKLSVANNGSGDLNFKGETNKASIVNAGSGDFGLARFTSRDVSIVNSGSGDIEIKCIGKLSVVNTGSGDIQIEGKPEKKSIVNTGSGDVSYDDGQE